MADPSAPAPAATSPELTGPAARVLAQIEEEATPHLGAMSRADGLLPAGGPRLALPDSHAAWDEAAAQLPAHWADLDARGILTDLPLLPAGPDDLADEDLWRASVVLGGLAYAYVRCDMHDLHLPSPVGVPGVIRLPWEQVTARMGRARPCLTLDDLALHNWTRIDPDGPVAVENLRLLVPQTGSPAERGFLMTFVEMTHRMTPMLDAMVRGQDAAVRADPEGLIGALLEVQDSLHALTEQALPKIDPVALADTHVDPVVWAKLIGPTGIPIVNGVSGVSGAAAAGLQALDGFLGRKSFATALGKESRKVASAYAPNVSRFVEAMAQRPVRDLVLHAGDDVLRGVFQSVVEAYAGDRGHLGAHRRKIYGYLQTATKVGRPSTATGIAGTYRSRAWQAAHRALEAARVERYLDMAIRPVDARLLSRTVIAEGSTGPVNEIRLDLSHTGLRARPGDRLAVLPVNAPELVERTLALLAATGEEVVPLTLPWRAELAARQDQPAVDCATLREVLDHAWLRPMTREVARNLLAFAPDSRLREVVGAREEDTWEVPDALEVLAESGVKLQRMWRAPLMDRETICRILPPQPPRMYSVASLHGERVLPDSAGLVVGGLEIDGPSPTGDPTPRRGTTSSLLTQRLAIGDEVDVTVVRPLRFTLPTDPDAGIIMVAAGTGVAPFMGFIADRESGAGENWLLLASRTPEQVPDPDRLRSWVDSGHLRLDVAWSKVSPDGGPTGRIDRLMVTDHIGPELVRRLTHGDTRLYVCGQGGFAGSVLRGIRAAVTAFAPDLDADALIGRLSASRRLMFDVFTTFTPTAELRAGERLIETSELVAHTEEATGWWTAINGVVYDMTLFRHLHPGGHRIIDDNVGVDCAGEFEAIRHHRDSEIQAMLEMYRIGLLRQLDLDGPWGIAIRAKGLEAVTLAELHRTWVQETYAVVELRSSLRNELAVHELPLGTEAPGTLTRLKLGLLTDTIQRACTDLVAVAVGVEIADLWAITCGLTNPGADATELGRRVVHALGHPPTTRLEAGLGAAWPDVLSGLEGLAAAPPTDPSTAERLRRSMAAVDTMLAEVVALLADGLRVFERHGNATLAEGGRDLQFALASVPSCLQRARVSLVSALAPAGVG